MKPETKYKGSIKLSAIGDALGWITEFEKNKSSLKKKFGQDRIDNFHNWEKLVGGKFYGFIDKIVAGSYSDDTQLMLSVARSLKGNGSVDQNYFAKDELSNWLYYARGGGRTVKKAADKIARKKIKWNNNFFEIRTDKSIINYRDSGANGAAMRILPIALANIGNETKIIFEIFCNSIITHGHPRAHIGAMLYGIAINQIIMYSLEDFKFDNFLTQIGKEFTQKFALSRIMNNELKDWIREWDSESSQKYEDIYDSILIETQTQLRMIYLSLKQDKPINSVISELGCFNNETKGSGTATVLAGLYLACKFNQKPIEGIIEAVNLIGSDTDSIAAFVGGLLGALCGQSIIPDKWKKVQDINYLDTIALNLLAISESRFEKLNIEVNKEISKNVKSLNVFEKDDFKKYDIVYFSPLGNGEITAIDRQNTLTKGKYNLIIKVEFDIGQSAIFSKIFDL